MTTTEFSTCLWFDGQGYAAAQVYCDLFDDAAITKVTYRKNADGSDGPPLMTAFRLGGQHYLALDGGPHYALSPAASISVTVDTQPEIDRLWAALLAEGGEEMRCGWLTDRFGLSWQILPAQLSQWLEGDDQKAASRVMEAMLAMVKFDIAALEAAARSD